MIRVKMTSVLIYTSLIMACIVNYISQNPLLSYIIFIPGILVALYHSANNPIFIIDVVLFLSFGATGLLPSLFVSGATLNWEDLVILYLFFVIMISIKYKAYYKVDSVGVLIIIFYIFRVIGAIRGNNIYDQNFLVGMLTLRDTYVYLMYFPISALMQKKVFDRSQVLAEIYKFTKILSIIYIIQLAFLYIGIDITNFSYDMRWGYRLRASNLLQCLGTFYIFYKLLVKKTEKGDIFWLIVFILEVIFINQSRVLLLGVFLTIGITIILNQGTRRKFAIIFMCLVVGSLALTNNKVRQIILESILESQSNDSGSMLYRKYEREYFDSKLYSHEWLGVGTPNMHDGKAAEYSGMLKSVVYRDYYMSGFYLSDLGVYEIEYHWGIIGVVLFWIFIVVSLLSCFNSLYIKKSYNIYDYLAFSIITLNIVVSPTLCYFITQPIIYLIIFILSFKKNYELKDANNE